MGENSNYMISMPHRHTVIYEEEELEVKFETELAIDGIIFYKRSGQVIKGETNNMDMIINRVVEWLNKDRVKSKVYVDNS
jgi:6,7-dimethyl-8-ribityllumazine synthase